MAYGEIEWSREQWRHVTPKGQIVTLIRLEPRISKTADYYTVSHKKWTPKQVTIIQ